MQILPKKCFFISETELTSLRAENIFRSYLLSEIQLSELRSNFENRLNDLKYLTGKFSDSVSFEKLYLPNDFIRAKNSYEELEKVSAEDIIEKYIILSYLYSNTFLFNIEENNYFSQTIFSRILQKRFKTATEIVEFIKTRRGRYRTAFRNFLDRETERLVLFPVATHESNKSPNDSFTNKFLTLLTDVWEHPREIKYVSCQFQAENQQSIMLGLIFEKVEKMLMEKLYADRRNLTMLLEYKQFLDGHITLSNLNIIKGFFVKANEELGFFKLPFDFKTQKNIQISALFEEFVNSPKRSSLSSIKETKALEYDFSDFSRRIEKYILSPEFSQETEVKNNLEKVFGGKFPDAEVMSSDQFEKISKSQGELIEEIELQLSPGGQLELSEKETKKFRRQLSLSKLDFSEVSVEEINKALSEGNTKEGRIQINSVLRKAGSSLEENNNNGDEVN